jgi:3-methyladenine DNA glycosylase AlkD
VSADLTCGMPVHESREQVTAARAKKKATQKSRQSHDAAAVLRDIERNASRQYRADMSARYGIVTRATVYGTPMAKLKLIAKKIGTDHALGEALWRSGVHDARMLATMIADPEKVTPALMDRWAKDFDNWAIVDTACFNLFDRSPQAFRQIAKWAKAKDEFVKRAGFALLASCALHGRGEEAEMLRALALVRDGASDPRNFVKKGVAWALRAIGGRKNEKLRRAARALAAELAASADPTERWVGRDGVKSLDNVSAK